MIDGLKLSSRITSVIMGQCHYAHKLETKLVDAVTFDYRNVSLRFSFIVEASWSETLEPTLKQHWAFWIKKCCWDTYFLLWLQSSINCQ